MSSIPESIDERIEILKSHNREFSRNIKILKNDVMKRKLIGDKEKTTVCWNVF